MICSCETCELNPVCLVRSTIWAHESLWEKIGILLVDMYTCVGVRCKRYQPEQEKTDAAEIP
jgi:hypothetical protein